MLVLYLQLVLQEEKTQNMHFTNKQLTFSETVDQNKPKQSKSQTFILSTIVTPDITNGTVYVDGNVMA